MTFQRTWRSTAASAVAGLAVSICGASTAGADESPPDVEGAEGIIHDLDRIVSNEDGAGWFLDDTSLEAIKVTVLQSVCRASESARSLALGTLEAHARKKGDPKALYVAHKGELDSEVKDALQATRMRDAMRRALSHIEDCPFWLRSEVGFNGRQSDRRRFTLSFETGGLLQLRRSDSAWTYGGGGTARLLLGRGFGAVSILVGFEFAGGAMLKPKSEPTEFVLNYFPSFPVVLRVKSGLWHFDFEAAPVSIFQKDNFALSWGGRLGFGVAVAAPRTRFLLPWAGIALGYEHYFPGGNREVADFFRAGFRVGALWDFHGG